MLFGSFDLKGMAGPDDRLVSFGTSHAGDSLGEEGLFEVGKVVRKDTSVADVDSYVLEISKS